MNIWKNQCIARVKQGFILDPFDWKLEFFNIFSVKSQMSVFITVFPSGQDGDDTSSSQMDRQK